MSFRDGWVFPPNVSFHLCVGRIRSQLGQRSPYPVGCACHCCFLEVKRELIPCLSVTRDFDLTRDCEAGRAILLPPLKTIRCDVNLVPLLCHYQQEPSKMNCL